MLRLPIFDEVLLAHAFFLLLAHVLERLEQCARSGEQLFRMRELVHRESTLNQTACLLQQVHACFSLVHDTNVTCRNEGETVSKCLRPQKGFCPSICTISITSVSVWKLNGRAAVAAVEDDEQRAVRWQCRNESLV